MKNLFLSLILVLVSITTASAYDFKQNGIAYDILSDGTLAVTHLGAAENLVVTGRMISTHGDPRDKPYLLYKGTVRIPSTVTYKGKEYKVTEIGYNAFFCCEGLSRLILPEGLRRIEFQSIVLTRIKSLDIPSTVTEISPGAITQNKYLKEITVSPGNPKYVSEGNCIYTKDMTQLVMVCPTLKSYGFPSTVTIVADFAFDSSKISRLVIPETVEYIGGQAFPSSAHFGSIVCDKVLKKLPGSDDFAPGGYYPLPLWAIGKEKYKWTEPLKVGPRLPQKYRENPWYYPYSIYEERVRKNQMRQTDVRRYL